MGLYKKLDLWSISDRLYDIIDYTWSDNRTDSIYWDYYSDQINEMSNLAAEMSNELQELLKKITYYSDLPHRDLDAYAEDESSLGASWFNAALCMLSDIDMAALLEGEDDYTSDEIRAKQKRIRMLERLTKKQQMWLYTEVIGFVMRYLELDAAFEVIQGIMHELDYHQIMVSGKSGNTMLPDAAYL